MPAMNLGSTVLGETLAVLRDYQARIDRIGAESFRLRGESFRAWKHKQRRLALVLELLQVAAEASARRQAELLIREVARAPEVDPHALAGRGEGERP